MSFHNSVSIVASPRRRVGKTLLSRLLTDFHVKEGRRAAAYDLNEGEGTLAQFLPEHVTRAEISDVKGQMALFDRLIAADKTSKLIDVGHAAFEPFFTLAAQIGFAEEARRRGIGVAVLFIASPDHTSIEAYRGLRARMPGAALTPVHNEILGPAPYAQKYFSSGASGMLQLPLLAPMVRKYVERAPFSFIDSRLAAALDVPLDVNLELHRWLRRIFREFRELDLRMMLNDLQVSMRS
jgi:hypothetical protein